MSTWYTSNLGDALLAEDSLARIRALYLVEQRQATGRNDMALFVRHESEGRLHCEVIVYYSPGAIAVAQAAGAHPCGKPSQIGLSLLAGAEASWSILFP